MDEFRSHTNLDDETECEERIGVVGECAAKGFRGRVTVVVSIVERDNVGGEKEEETLAVCNEDSDSFDIDNDGVGVDD